MRSKGVPAAAVVVLVCAAMGGLLGGRVMARQDRVTERYRMYTAALAAVETGYVEAPDSAQLVYASIDGMLHTLDPHSTFFDPRAYAQMREQQEGSYYGLGIKIQSLDGDISVVSVFEGSPADRVGIRRGDVIAVIEGTSAKGLSTDQAVAKLKGPKGTTVKIGVRRPGVDDLIDLTVVRDEVHILTVPSAFMMAPGTGYIHIQDFSDTTDHELTAALKKLDGQGMKRLLLDLRDNPGGPLMQAIAVASHFLKKGQEVVATHGRLANSDQNYLVKEDGDHTSIPLILLVDRQSASASEIVTGAMQDHDRALIVGETTFGKALVQSVFSISNGAAVALTTAHYYTPSGRIIQRPWDPSFDEYQTYVFREQEKPKSHPASELKYTDAGRKVYGGGGIEPDRFVPGATEGFDPSMSTQMLVNRGAFTAFTSRFIAKGDTRPGARQSAAIYTVSPGWTVTEAMIAEFRKSIQAHGAKIDEAAFTADLPFIKAEIKFEVDSELFGAEEARQSIIKVDPQAQSALADFDDAKKLLELKKAS